VRSMWKRRRREIKSIALANFLIIGVVLINV
jgi:hypothetical protein